MTSRTLSDVIFYHPLLRAIACVLYGVVPAFAQESKLVTRDPDLTRQNLLVYRTGDGRLKKIDSANDWQHRRAHTIRSMEAVMGAFPGDAKRCDLDVEIVEEVDCDSYVRRLIYYRAEPNSRVPAYLLIPKRCIENKGYKAAAVLCLHPTDNRIGHKVVVGMGDMEHHKSREYAKELAERGFVTLAPSYPLLAEYQPKVRHLGYESGTMKAIWDNVRGIDLLLSLPFVDGARGVGAIGHSLGGHNAVYTAVFDERIKVIVSSCGLDAYTDYYDGDPERWQSGSGWCQLRYIPRLANYRGRLKDIPFDFHEMIAALAPRHVLISAPKKDGNFRWQSVDRIAAAAGPVYRLHGAGNHLRVEHPDCGHDFPEAAREMAYRWIEHVLGTPTG